MQPPLHRTSAVLAGLLLVLASPVVRAAPPHLHDADSTFAVPADVTAVVVDVDSGAVAVRAGSGAGSVHTQWDLWQPTFTRTVSGHTLRLTGRCAAQRSPLPLVQVTGSDPGCAVDLTVPVPADVRLTVLDATTASASGIQGAVDVTADSTVTLDALGPGAVRGRSLSGDLQLTGSRPATADLGASSAVSVGRVSTGVLRAVSDASSVTLSRLAATRQLVVTASSDVQLEHASSPETTLTSESGAVSVLDGQLSRLTATGSSTVTVDGLRSRVGVLRSEAARVRVLRSRIADLTARGSDSVAVTLQQAPPRRVQLTSEAAWVSLVVPRARYAVSTHTDSGHVTVADVVVDPRSPRTLSATASTDISIT